MNEEVQVGEFPLPLKQYVVRCIGCTFETSKKGNPMYKQIWEIVTPTAEYRGQQWKCAGLQFTNFTTLTDSAKNANEKLCAKLQIKPSLDANAPNPEAFLGIGARAVLSGSEKQWKEKVELGDGTFKEEVMKDDNGKPITTYEIRLHAVLGFVGRDRTADLNVAF